MCNYVIDNFPYRQIFYLDKFRQQKPNSRKEPFKSSKICAVWKCVENIAFFFLIVLRTETATTFKAESGSNFRA